MRTLILSIATAASALAIGSPASAQYYPQPQPGYGAPYGNAYGYNNYGQVRALQARIDQLQNQIKRLDKRNILSNREADRLRAESRNLEQRLRYASRNGLNQREMASVQQGIAHLEQRIYREANDRDRRGWNNNGYGQNNQGWDRDRDGRDDRYEDDRGTRRDYVSRLGPKRRRAGAIRREFFFYGRLDIGWQSARGRATTTAQGLRRPWPSRRSCPSTRVRKSGR
jgi:hypothetical protein